MFEVLIFNNILSLIFCNITEQYNKEKGPLSFATYHVSPRFVLISCPDLSLLFLFFVLLLFCYSSVGLCCFPFWNWHDGTLCGIRVCLHTYLFLICVFLLEFFSVDGFFSFQAVISLLFYVLLLIGARFSSYFKPLPSFLYIYC